MFKVVTSTWQVNFISPFQHFCPATTFNSIPSAHLPGAVRTVFPGGWVCDRGDRATAPSGVGRHRCVLQDVWQYASYSSEVPLHIQSPRSVQGKELCQNYFLWFDFTITVVIGSNTVGPCTLGWRCADEKFIIINSTFSNIKNPNMHTVWNHIKEMCSVIYHFISVIHVCMYQCIYIN